MTDKTQRRATKNRATDTYSDEDWDRYEEMSEAEQSRFIESRLEAMGVGDPPEPADDIDWEAALTALRSGQSDSPALRELRARLGPAGHLLDLPMDDE